MNDISATLREPPTRPKALGILEAARSLFLTRGYGAVSMDAVAKTARVSKATVYAHFKSKDELFAAIVAWMAERLTQEIRAVMDAGLPLHDALTEIGGRFLAVLTDPDRIRMFRMMMGEMDRFPELGRVFYRSGPLVMHDYLARYLEGASVAGVASIPDPAIAAGQFLSLIKGDLHLRCLFDMGSMPKAADRRHQVAAAVDMFLKAYGAPKRN